LDGWVFGINSPCPLWEKDEEEAYAKPRAESPLDTGGEPFNELRSSGQS